jgi:hypothetical protein
VDSAASDPELESYDLNETPVLRLLSSLTEGTEASRPLGLTSLPQYFHAAVLLNANIPLERDVQLSW